VHVRPIRFQTVPEGPELAKANRQTENPKQLVLDGDAYQARRLPSSIGGGNGFLGPVGHRQMMNPSVMNLEHRPS